MARLAQFCGQAEAQWVLQLDISKYFFSMQHDRLKERALRYVGDSDIRRLLAQLIDSFHTDDSYDHLFAADSAYRRTRHKGIPIGNLPSQLFANIYLAGFDRHVKEVLRVKRYIRYVDDMVFVSHSQEALRVIADQVTQVLAEDGLTVHPRKLRLAPVNAGVPFLGYVVWPAHVGAGRRIMRRYHRRLRQDAAGTDCGAALESYRGLLMHTGARR